MTYMSVQTSDDFLTDLLTIVMSQASNAFEKIADDLPCSAQTLISELTYFISLIKKTRHSFASYTKIKLMNITSLK